MKWHEDDELWQGLAPYFFDEQRWAAAPAEVDRIIRLLAAPARAEILDLCCGPGRHCLELARRGFSVVGVDRTEAYLREASLRAKAQGLALEFVQEDMRRFVRDKAFDFALNLYTAFGYFEEPEDDRQVLLNLQRSLRPGGKLLMDLMGKEILAGIFRERDWHQEADGTVVLEERKLSQNWSWIDSRWVLINAQGRREFVASHRLYSAAELSALLASCGFGNVSVFGDFAGAPYDQNAKRLVVLAEK